MKTYIRHNPLYARLDSVEPESWTVIDAEGTVVAGPFSSHAEAQAADLDATDE